MKSVAVDCVHLTMSYHRAELALYKLAENLHFVA